MNHIRSAEELFFEYDSVICSRSPVLSIHFEKKGGCFCGPLAADGRCAPECRFMARLLIANDTVTIDMSRGERFEAAHGDQTFPRSAITGARAVPDCIAEVHGLK